MSSESDFLEFVRGKHTNLILGFLEILDLENLCDQWKWRPKTFLVPMKRCSHTIHICLISYLLKQQSVRYKMWQLVRRLSATDNPDIHFVRCHIPITIFFDYLGPFTGQTWCFFTKQNLVKCGK